MEGRAENNIKDFVLLYKSDRQAVRAFRDALIKEANGLIDIHDEIDISIPEAELRELSKLNHVILVRLSSDTVSDLESVIRQFINPDSNVLHHKVITVSFGQNLPNGWLPENVTRQNGGVKDFCMGFDDERNLTREDFESDEAKVKLNELVTTIVATN